MRSDGKILEALARFSRLMWARDVALLAEFANDADILLAASDAGVMGRGPREVGDLLRGVFALPDRIRWEWRERFISREGGIAWLYAEGDMILGGEGGESRLPYRASGVLQLEAGTWKWRMFHGSEPKT